MSLVLKLSLVPLVIWLASEAGRRWGHSVTGWITGLPLIAGPISLYLALDPGPQFAATTAHAILQTSPAAAAHCLAFALAAQRFGWIGSLLIGLGTFFAVSFAVTAWPLSLGAALLLMMVAMTVAILALPRVRQTSGPVAIPRTEIAVRMLFAFLIALAAIMLAGTIGTRLAGIMLTFPISGIVLPVFTQALYGAAATTQLIRGFLLGLYGFATFFFVVASGLPHFGVVTTYLAGVASAILLTLIITHLYSRSGLARAPLSRSS